MMWKTFFVSPAGGAVAAMLGWIGAVLFKESMSEAEFANLQFGWTGAMVAATAVAVLFVLFMASDLVEPLVMTVTAAVGSAVLWDRQELPFSTDNFQGTNASYWFTFTMMAIVFLLLLMGLRAARESSHRVRSGRG